MSLKQAYRGGHSVTGKPGWFLEFTYDDALVQRIKKIPPADRQWDEELKRWWVSEEHAEDVASWLHGFAAFLRQKAMF